MQLLTVGHGTARQENFLRLLTDQGVERLVDVRTAPGSRRHPHFRSQAMEGWLAEAGIGYRWERALGGWRKLAPDSPNTALRNESFRGYADYMRTGQFWEALQSLTQQAEGERTVVMCSESLWWRCHRRLLADAAILALGVEVLHLMHDRRLVRHHLTGGVRLGEEGLPVYDVGGAPTLPDVG
ncbi:MAG: DUF488 domain-containing protein [Actinomycetota bacterium]|nr:DUF488 domain-containing protein [Actinomycetota bacterium]